ncbi:MAG TPA: hypothetical protein V6D23_25820 [Candidatus Obscuribacterales bacterium]
MKLKIQRNWLLAGSLSLSLLGCTQSLPQPSSRPEPAQMAAVAPSRPALPVNRATAQIIAHDQNEEIKVHLHLGRRFKTQLFGIGQVAFVRLDVTGKGFSSTYSNTGGLVPVSDDLTLSLSGLPRQNGNIRLVTLRGFDADQQEIESFQLGGYYVSDADQSSASLTLSRADVLLVRVLEQVLDNNPAMLQTLDVPALKALLAQAVGVDPSGRLPLAFDPSTYDAQAIYALLPPSGTPLPSLSTIQTDTDVTPQSVNLTLNTPEGGTFGEALTAYLDDSTSRPFQVAKGADSGEPVTINNVLWGNWNLVVLGEDGREVGRTTVTVNGSGVTVADPALVLADAIEIPLLTQANTFTTGTQNKPAVAMDDDGDFVVVWASDGQDGSDYGVYFQRFDSNGDPAGTETLVNSFGTVDQQFHPDVAMDADGDFVVVWEGYNSFSGSNEIFAKHFFSNGSPKSLDAQANEFTTGDQRNPQVAMDASGNYVIAWESSNQYDTGLGIYARRYTNGDSPVAGEFHVNTLTAGSQAHPDVAMDADGDFVVTYDSYGVDTDSQGIAFQRFNAAAAPQGGETLVNTYETDNQSDPVIGMSDSGAFAIAWTSFDQDGDGLGIFAKTFTSAGVGGSEIQVNTDETISDQREPRIAMDADGDFTIGWFAYYYDEGTSYYDYDIAFRRYNASGVPQSNEVKVVDSVPNIGNFNPAIGMDANGNFALFWAIQNEDGSNEGIFGYLYDANGNLR